VLDNNMPGRDGLAVFRMQRFMRPRSPIPTVILSADATDTALKAAREAGVDAYLTKPVDGRRLLTTLARIARPGAAGTGTGAPGGKAAGAAPEAGGRPAARSAGVRNGKAGGDEPILDPEKVASLRRLGDAGAFFDELVAGFEQDVRTATARLDEALGDADYPAMRAALHAIRGSAVELGASRLAAVASQLRGLRPGELRSARAEALRTHLHETLDTTLRQLRRS
jgi:two-component system sensor histidine kinase RpfC